MKRTKEINKMRRNYMFYNEDLGECYFAIADSIDEAWDIIAGCIGDEYAACVLDFVGRF
jgi:hypothetical protein